MKNLVIDVGKTLKISNGKNNNLYLQIIIL